MTAVGYIPIAVALYHGKVYFAVWLDSCSICLWRGKNEKVTRIFKGL